MSHEGSNSFELHLLSVLQCEKTPCLTATTGPFTSRVCTKLLGATDLAPPSKGKELQKGTTAMSKGSSWFLQLSWLNLGLEVGGSKKEKTTNPHLF